VSCQLKLSENVGEFIGDYRRAVSGRITDASDVVSLLSTGIYLTLAHIEDGEGLTVDDFRFDDFDIHFSFLFFLSFWLYPIIPMSSSKVKRSLEFFLDLVISLMIPSTYVIWIFLGRHWTLWRMRITTIGKIGKEGWYFIFQVSTEFFTLKTRGGSNAIRTQKY